jgi:hypothetical protein
MYQSDAAQLLQYQTLCVESIARLVLAGVAADSDLECSMLM